MAHKLPPALPGAPLIGNLLEYRRDHIEVFRRAYRTLGPIFSIRLGPQRAVVLVGPEYHRFFFTQVDHILSMPEMYRFVIPMFGRVLNAIPEEETRKSQLSLIHSAFQGRNMQHYAAVMAEETLTWLGTLGESGAFELYNSLSALSMNIAARALIGPEIRREMDSFRPLFEDLARGMEFVLPPNLPLPRFRRRDRARRLLNAMIKPIIAARQAFPQRHEDFLQAIIRGRTAENGLGDDETLVGFALMTVFTGYITTAAQTCWSLIQLLQNPDYLAEVCGEQAALLGDRPESMTLEMAGRLERLSWALKESQRMHPVMSHYARYNAQDYEMDGYLIPRGWLTMVCPAVAHRSPDLFTCPEMYDPKRFAPDRAEDRRHPYGLIGFSAGIYRCPGAHFGMLEMKYILSLLLQRYTMELVEAQPRRNFEMGVIRPDPPCMIRYQRRAHRDDTGSGVPLASIATLSSST